MGQAGGAGSLPASLLVALLAAVALVLAFLLWKARYTRAVRQDAVQRSLAVTAGKVYEQLLPYLPDFPFNPKDVRFLGSPVDFVVFDGLSDGQVTRVVFVEVKTGGAELSPRERRVRDAVRERRVEWHELRLEDRA
jgi:predicted Holliday junction resolvase-like endonuclease